MSPKKSKTTKASLKKTGTMAATVAAGQDFLKRAGGEDQSNETKAAAKPKLSKARTMQNTAKEAKVLLGKEILADTRLETKRRQAAANAKKTPAKANKPKGGRKPALKRLGTMAKTANEGKAYVKRTGKKTTGRKRTGGRKKTSSK